MPKPEDKFINASGLNLHYLDWGNSNATPMLLLHGISSNAHHWDFFARSMPADYHVLALDQRGHGDSDWAASYGPRDFVLDIESFVAELGLSNIVLIGHSIGGVNAIAYAARNPERVHNLVIIDIGPELAAAGVERMQQGWSNEPESFLSEEEAIQYMKQNDPWQSDAFAQHQVKHSFKRSEAGRLIFKYDKALCRNEIRSPEWLWEYIEQIVCPTLLIHGRESDLLTAESARRTVNALAFGSLLDIDNAGHNVPGDNPAAFESTVKRFLA